MAAPDLQKHKTITVVATKEDMCNVLPREACPISAPHAHMPQGESSKVSVLFFWSRLAWQIALWYATFYVLGHYTPLWHWSVLISSFVVALLAGWTYDEAVE